MKERVRQIHNEINQDIDDSGVTEDPLPISTQMDIVEESVGRKRRGTHVSGVGRSLTRPPLPRGRARDVGETHQLREELRRAIEDAERTKAEYEARFRALEELVKGGSVGVGSHGQSDNASLS